MALMGSGHDKQNTQETLSKQRRKLHPRNTGSICGKSGSHCKGWTCMWRFSMFPHGNFQSLGWQLVADHFYYFSTLKWLCRQIGTELYDKYWIRSAICLHFDCMMQILEQNYAFRDRQHLLCQHSGPNCCEYINFGWMYRHFGWCLSTFQTENFDFPSISRLRCRLWHPCNRIACGALTTEVAAWQPTCRQHKLTAEVTHNTMVALRSAHLNWNIDP